MNNIFLEFANQMADQSAIIARKYFRNNSFEEVKSDKSPVTIADKEIEEKLREMILKKFPHHGICGEEYQNVNTESEYQWVIDPIDGTSSFIIGRPTFTTLISLIYKKKPIIGIINQPINNERWIGVDDHSSLSGAWFNGKQIKTRQCKDIENAIISTTSDFFFEKNDLEKFYKIARKAKYQKFGGVVYGADSYAYGLLSLGLIDIIIEPKLQIYDYAALIPIIKKSGGIITKWDGNEPCLQSNIEIVATGSKELHEKVLKILI